MGIVTNLADGILFVFFLAIAIGAPVMDFQNIFRQLYPTALIDLKLWYIDSFEDYLFKEKPNFFVGITWVELIIQWPISVLNVVGILTRKTWLSTTCLIYGVSVLTSMAAILADMVGSQKASDNMLMLYIPFFGSAVLSTLRGLLTNPGKTITIFSKHQVGTKKRTKKA